MKRQEGEKRHFSELPGAYAGVELVIPGVTGLCWGGPGSGPQRPVTLRAEEVREPGHLPRTGRVRSRDIHPRPQPLRVARPQARLTHQASFRGTPHPCAGPVQVEAGRGSRRKGQDGEGLGGGRAESRGEAGSAEEPPREARSWAAPTAWPGLHPGLGSCAGRADPRLPGPGAGPGGNQEVPGGGSGPQTRIPA